MNRNAVLASGVPIRRSEAMAMIAPAPTQTPSTAAITGLPQFTIALTRSPVIRVKASSSSVSCYRPPNNETERRDRSQRVPVDVKGAKRGVGGDEAERE